MNLVLRRRAPGKTPGEPSIDAIFEEDLDFIVRTVERLGVPSADALDVTQDVLQAAHIAMPTFDKARRLRPWLFGITVRQVGHYFERARRGRAEPLDEAKHAQLQDDAPTSEERMILDERRRLVHGALSALPLDQRAIFIAYELDEMKMEEVAESFGIPEGTAWTRLRAARKSFQAAILRQKKSLLGGVLPLPLFSATWRQSRRLRQAINAFTITLAGAACGGAVVYATMSRPAPVTTVVVHDDAPAPPATSTSAEPEAKPPAAAPTPSSPPVQRAAAATSTPRSASSANGDAELGAEQALMLAASTAFGRGDDEATRAALAEHARRFPGGRHAASREALWIQLLVREGRMAEAREKLATFRRAFPNSKMEPTLSALVSIEK